MTDPKNIEQNKLPFFSFVIPIFERENELKELLESISLQTAKNFEVLVIDDGSKTNLSLTTDLFKNKLAITYKYKTNQGASIARNYAANLAKGNYLLFVDSDCILPINYIKSLNQFLEKNKIEFFGGPDDASQDFSPLQKALSYAMTSFFTTGGIRGGLNTKNFQPRSFNMGVSKNLFLEMNGFKDIKVGEDIDLSLRIKAKGIKIALIPDAKVFHKRRNSLISFTKRVYSFGKMRPLLINWFPETNKIVFYLPSMLLLGFTVLSILAFMNKIALITILIWVSCIFSESFLKHKNLLVSFLALITSFLQVNAYGLGFLKGFITVNILRKLRFNV